MAAEVFGLMLADWARLQPSPSQQELIGARFLPPQLFISVTMNLTMMTST